MWIIDMHIDKHGEANRHAHVYMKIHRML